MTHYLIKAFTEVFEDHYTDGEGVSVDFYTNTAEITAENVKDAILNFLGKEMYFSNGYFDDETTIYITTVDNENDEVSEEDTRILERFKNNDIILYNSYTRFQIFEMHEVFNNQNPTI